jgi:hypothetical protein
MPHQKYNLSVRETAARAGSTANQPGGPNTVMQVADLITDDDASTVETAGYFNASAARLRKGTRICAVLNFALVPVAKDYVVTANTGTVVTIAPAV